MEKTEQSVRCPTYDESQHDDESHSEQEVHSMKNNPLQSPTSGSFKGVSTVSTKEQIIFFEC